MIQCYNTSCKIVFPFMRPDNDPRYYMHNFISAFLTEIFAGDETAYVM